MKMKNYKEEFILSEQEKIERFGEGEWVKEPDAVNFEYLGYDIKILRMLTVGHFCGYIYVNKDHPWTGYDFVSHHFLGEKAGGFHIEVHGGVTFAKYSENNTKYVIGFDCAHFNDLAPAAQKERLTFKNPKLLILYETVKYRNLAYVIKECKSLAKQAKAAEKKSINLAIVKS